MFKFCILSDNGELPGRPALYLVIYINVRATLRSVSFAYRQVQVQLKMWLRGPEVGRAIPCKNWRWDAGGTEVGRAIPCKNWRWDAGGTEVGRRWDQKW